MQLIQNMVEWFKSLSNGLKVLVIIVGVVVALLASRAVYVIAALVFTVGLVVLIIRAVRRRPLRQWGIVTLSALVLAIVFGTISGASNEGSTPPQRGTTTNESPTQEAVSPTTTEAPTQEAASPSTTEAPTQAPKSSKDQSANKGQPDPINLFGTGQMATNQFNLESGLAIFRMTHQGNANFIVQLLDDSGNQASDPLGGTLANKIGSFEGSLAAQAKAGQYVLDVQADGPWTVTVEQPHPSSAAETTSFSGTSTTATDFFQLPKGLKTFEMSHQGDANFIVRLLDKNGAPASDPLGGTLTNTIGPFSGSKAVRVSKGDIYLLQVEANGPWTIDVK